MSDKLRWYWYRLRAMNAAEVGGRVLKKIRQWADGRSLPDWSKLPLTPRQPAGFPTLPSATAAPAALRDALRRDTDAILGGRWKAFGHLEIQVDDPPRWHADYLCGANRVTDQSAFRLDHRQQPGGADIKLIWEPNRWYQLVRLAQSAWLLNDRRAAETCRRWLVDWVKQNPPYRGLNWTSALETGMRLVQFTWIDALLTAANLSGAEWSQVCGGILPAHAWYTWRHRSFGSSANNHLLGELAGLILAVARWPALAGLATPLPELQRRWEREVVRQFAPDGGNREQALGYHLFSLEFCWQTQAALRAAQRSVSTEVAERLARAGTFYARLKRDEWDYGDSDNACVTPFFADETNAAGEWRAWFERPESSPAIQFWCQAMVEDQTLATSRPSHEPSPVRPAGPLSSSMGEDRREGLAGFKAPPRWFAGHRPDARTEGPGIPSGWRVFPDSGYAVFESADWGLRWDLSPLGYLATAAHGHLDALHLSLAHRGVSFVIDPGTGAYYADPVVRRYLASWRAHNGPHPVDADFPARLGTFLWGKPHAAPTWQAAGATVLLGELELPRGWMQRIVRRLENEPGWEVTDGFRPKSSAGKTEFAVHWQFPPGTRLDPVGERQFNATRHGVGLRVECTPGWSSAQVIVPGGRETNPSVHCLADLGSAPLETVCSPAFRRLQTGPGLWLSGHGDLTADCRTRFLIGECREEGAPDR